MTLAAQLKRSLACATLLAIFAGLAGTGTALAADDYAKESIDIGMIVTDIEKSVEFYTKAIGMKELKGFSVPADVANKSGLTNNKPLTVRVLSLGDAKDGTHLKLIALPNTQSAPSENEYIHSQLGFRYLTIYVKDTNAAVERLKEAGARPVAKSPVELPKSLAPGMFLTVVRDPDGNFVELVGPKK